MNKGMAYTSFAVMTSAILLTTILIPFNTYQASTNGDEVLIGQAAFNIDSIRNDLERAHDIAFQRSLAEVKGQALQAQDPIEDPEERITEAKIEGEFLGEELEFMENASIEGWFETVEEAATESGHRTNYNLVEVEYEEISQDFVVNSTLELEITLLDDSTSTQFNRTRIVQNSATYRGLEDPMHRLRTDDFYGHIMTRCTFDEPAVFLDEGTEDSGSDVHAYALINPTIEEEEDYSENILVTDNLEDYEPEQTEDFAAIITVDEEEDIEEFNEHYVMEADISEIENQMSITIHNEQVWNTRFREIINQTCYISSTGEQNGPTFLERMQNQVTSEEEVGLLTVVDKDDESGILDDSASNIDYVHFNEDAEEIYGENQEIAGISTTDSGTNAVTNFLLDEYHVEEFELEELTN